MRFIFPLLTALCSCLFLHAQQHPFENGFIVLLNNDTVKGYIRNEFWERAPQTIAFRKTMEGEIQELHPAELKMFSVGRFRYEAYITWVNNKSLAIKDLGFDKDMHFVNDTIFMQTIVQSDAGLSLYLYVDAYASEHFFIKKENALQELIFNAYFKDTPDTLFFIQKYDYILTLTEMMRSCFQQELINSISFQLVPIRDIVLAYNACDDHPVEYLASVNKFTFSFGLHGGISGSNIFMDAGEGTALAEAEIPSSVNFTAAVSCNIFLPLKAKHWSVYNALLYKTHHFEGISDVEYSSYILHNTYLIDLKYLTLINGVRYQYYFDHFTPFASLFISNGKALSIQQEHTKQTVYDDGTTGVLSEDLITDNLKKMEIGFGLAAGVSVFKHIEFAYQFEKSNGFSNGLVTDVSTHYITLGYLF